MKKNLSKILFSIFIIVLTSCTSTPKATQYPERYIDQPYTLPSKVDIWETSGTVYSKKENKITDSLLIPIPIPLFWEHSLSDNLTLEIPVIPIGLRWKIKSDEFSEIGMHFGYSFIYSTLHGTNLRPMTELFYKSYNDKDHAFILIPQLEYSYYADKTEQSYLNGSLHIGYLSQINEKNAWEPSLTVGMSSYNNRLYFPLHIFYTYRLTQVWQFESNYIYEHLGYENFVGHILNFSFKKFF